MGARLLALVLVLSSPSVALAQDDGRALFRRGVELLRADAPRDAAEAFRRSYELAPRAATLCNLALAYERSEQDAEALAAYEGCANDDESGRFREHALERANAIRASMPPPPVELAVEPEPEVAVEPPPEEHIAPAPVEVARRSPPPPPEPRDRTLLVVGISGAVVSTAGLIAAIVIASGVSDDANALDDRYPTGEIPRTVDGRANPDVAELEDAKDRGTLSDVLFIGSAVVGAASLACVAIDLWQSSEEPAHPYAALRVSGTSVAIAGRF